MLHRVEQIPMPEQGKLKLVLDIVDTRRFAIENGSRPHLAIGLRVFVDGSLANQARREFEHLGFVEVLDFHVVLAQRDQVVCVLVRERDDGHPQCFRTFAAEFEAELVSETSGAFGVGSARRVVFGNGSAVVSALLPFVFFRSALTFACGRAGTGARFGAGAGAVGFVGTVVGARPSALGAAVGPLSVSVFFFVVVTVTIIP